MILWKMIIANQLEEKIIYFILFSQRVIFIEFFFASNVNGIYRFLECHHFTGRVLHQFRLQNVFFEVFDRLL